MSGSGNNNQHSTECFYCGSPVRPGAHEDDHFPIPKRAGGTRVVCACYECHDLKDRTPLHRWDVTLGCLAMKEVWGEDPPNRHARLLLAKLLALIAESTTHEAEEALAGDGR